jgi:hypothetical protein
MQPSTAGYKEQTTSQSAMVKNKLEHYHNTAKNNAYNINQIKTQTKASQTGKMLKYKKIKINKNFQLSLSIVTMLDQPNLFKNAKNDILF